MIQLTLSQAVTQHVKDHYEEYSIDPNEKLNIYPFLKRSDTLRPTACSWNTPETGLHQFVYVTPSRLDDKEHLLFIKYYFGATEQNSLVYCGTLAASDTTILSDQLNHMKRMANSGTSKKIQIIEILSSLVFRVLDVTKTVKDLELRTGSILVLQLEYPEMAIKPDVPLTGLVWGPYGEEMIPTFPIQHVLTESLFDQAMHGEYTDVIISAPRTSPHEFQFTVHKSVMSLLPYFKSAFTVGMRESSNNTHIVKLEVPINVDQFVFREFLCFTYLRNDSRTAKLSTGLLLSLLRLADYYGFEELVRSVVDVLAKRYRCLTGQMALQLLSTIQPLRFHNKQILKEMVLTYITFNFRDVGKLSTFRELDDEIYETVIDHVSRAILYPNGVQTEESAQ